MVKQIYQLTESFPKSQMYGLANQMQRAAVSVPSNIAEGAGRNTEKDFIRFLDIANGSSFELETQLLLSVDLGFSEQGQVGPILSSLKEIQKMLYKFRKILASKS
ncbi:MAG: four helix bundle protein [Prolixibacteraceae bacterium]|nr:four helix bundle protein [Prolixibacteraceae bacterium]